MSEVRIHFNDHGVKCCNRTERTDTPECITRMRFGVGEAFFAADTMVGSVFIRPFYRAPNDFGMMDGEVRQ